jgi:hypothetical protein
MTSTIIILENCKATLVIMRPFDYFFQKTMMLLKNITNFGTKVSTMRSPTAPEH